MPASDFGFQVIFFENACAARDLKYGDTIIPAEMVHKSFLAALKTYGNVMKTEEVIALLAAEQKNKQIGSHLMKCIHQLDLVSGLFYNEDRRRQYKS